jgi:hypothetical protein
LIDATLKLYLRVLVKILVKENSSSKCEMTKQYMIQPTRAHPLELSTQTKENKTAIFEVIKIYSKFFGRLEFSRM